MILYLKGRFFIFGILCEISSFLGLFSCRAENAVCQRKMSFSAVFQNRFCKENSFLLHKQLLWIPQFFKYRSKRYDRIASVRDFYLRCDSLTIFRGEQGILLDSSHFESAYRFMKTNERNQKERPQTFARRMFRRSIILNRHSSQVLFTTLPSLKNRQPLRLPALCDEERAA